LVQGVGLGFRRDLADEILGLTGNRPQFLELAPENWMGMGGYWGKKLQQAAEKYPIICHGLSLSLGSPEPLDREFLKQIKIFLREFPVQMYSEHLSFSKCDNAHFYDLLPIPFREDAVRHVAQRIRQVQDYLERPLAIENISYYTTVTAEMSEAEFIRAVVEESGCNLLLDINNVYVNAFNHHYDAREFISRLPLERVTNIHMAGHEQVSPDLIVDTHGQAIIDPVYELYEWTIRKIKPVPVLLERDFNFPQISELQDELSRIQRITEQVQEADYAVAS